MSECSKLYFQFNTEYKKTEEFPSELFSKGKTIYEVIKLKNKLPLFFEKHYNRLLNTAKIEHLVLPFTDIELFEKIINLAEKNEVTDESIKLVFSFDNDYFGEKTNYFLAYFIQSTVTRTSLYNEGINVISCFSERNNPNAKVLNPNQRSNWNSILSEKMVSEVILVDRCGNLTEGSRSNFFAIKNNEVYTTPIAKVLPGITRNNVIEICKNENIPIFEKNIHYKDISSFDALFITGTSRKIMPIRTFDEHEFSVSNELLRLLIKKYDILIENYINLHSIKRNLFSLI